MNEILIIAADPGKAGALVVINDNSMLLSAIATPRIGKDGPVDVVEEWKWIIDTMSAYKPRRIIFVIEDVHALFGVSTTATASLMENKGQLEGLFYAAASHISKSDDIPCSVHFIAPKAWQKEVWSHADKVMKASKIDTKKTSLACAKRLWPNESFLATPRSKVPHDGIVDAMLIAEAARRLF